MIVGGIESSAVLFWGITGLAMANTSGGGLCKGILLWIGGIWLLCMTDWCMFVCLFKGRIDWCMMASTSIVSLRVWMQAGLYWSLLLGAIGPSLLKYWGNGAQGSSLMGLGVDLWLPDPDWSICLKGKKKEIISFSWNRQHLCTFKTMTSSVLLNWQLTFTRILLSTYLLYCGYYGHDAICVDHWDYFLQNKLLGWTWMRLQFLRCYSCGHSWDPGHLGLRRN